MWKFWVLKYIIIDIKWFGLVFITFFWKIFWVSIFAVILARTWNYDEIKNVTQWLLGECSKIWLNSSERNVKMAKVAFYVFKKCPFWLISHTHEKTNWFTVWTSHLSPNCLSSFIHTKKSLSHTLIILIYIYCPVLIHLSAECFECGVNISMLTVVIFLSINQERNKLSL